MKTPAVLVLLFTLLSLAAGAESSGFNAVQLNNLGLEFLKNQNFSMAQDDFIKALAEDPLHPAIHYNLGLAFEGLQQMDKAKSSFQTALKLATDPQLKFMALYNLGEMAGREKKVPEALDYYQAALEFNPDSHETKVNIELLIQDQQKQGGQNNQEQNQQDPKKQDDKKDSKDQDKKDDQKQKDQDDKKDQKDEKPKQYEKSKPQPKPFKSDELTQGDVNKILGELKQQEQKIRAEFNRREVKEKARDKDW